jgi:NADPH:quinone reductase-like Zn-dependent oxidoreductase
LPHAGHRNQQARRPGGPDARRSADADAGARGDPHRRGGVRGQSPGRHAAAGEVSAAARRIRPARARGGGHRGRLEAGERLLVHGGSSGIGTTAIQLATAFGAKVFATAGSVDKCAACERLGAERAINYHEEDFVEVVKQLTGGDGVDVVLDMVGGEYTPRNISILAPGGRLVQIAILGGPKSTINWIPILQRRLTLTGSTLRARPVAEKAAIAQALLRKVWPILERGQARPVVHATFPLREAIEAHRLMDAGTHIGKIVLIAQPAS